jgi:hypothetical protein
MQLGGLFHMWYHVQWRTPRASSRAGVAQLVEYLPSKQGVAGSSPVSRSRDEFKGFLAYVLYWEPLC